MNDQAERVKTERRMRGWSIRDAATAGGVSNTLWGLYERTGEAGPAMQRAVCLAFSWPANWQDELPPLPTAAIGEIELLRSEMAGLREQLREVLEVAVDLAAELRRSKLGDDGEHPTTAVPKPRRAAGR